MKTIVFAPLFLAVCFGARAADSDPVASFKAFSKGFPSESTFARGPKYAISKVSIDVKKTNSLISPVAGFIDYTANWTTRTEDAQQLQGVLDLRLEFAWIDGNWKFSKMINRKTNIDFTELRGGQDMLNNGALKAFLGR